MINLMIGYLFLVSSISTFIHHYSKKLCSLKSTRNLSQHIHGPDLQNFILCLPVNIPLGLLL